MQKRYIILILIILAILAQGIYNGFSYKESASDINILTKPEPGNAIVDNIDILVLESFPLQINAVVSGNVPDGCTTVFEKEIALIDKTFYVVLDNSRNPDDICIQVITPYEKNIALNIYNFKAGEYFVDVNGVVKSFVLDQDNILYN